MAKSYLTFSHAYECEVLTETSGRDIRRFFYPGAAPHAGHDGVTVRVKPLDGEPWIGTFAFGQVTQKGMTGVFSTPAPGKLCVVAQGCGFVVAVDEPTRWELVRANPVIDVRAIVKHGLIIFATYTELVAYDSNGIRWHTPRLTWDSMKIVEATEDQIRGEFWDIRREATQEFVVDVATGNHQGGIEP